MDAETLRETNAGFEAITGYLSSDKNRVAEFPLSDDVISQVEATYGMNDEEKVAYYNDKVAELRGVAGDLRDESAEEQLDIPGMGRYRFEFHGRRKPGHDSHDEEVSLRMSRVLPTKGYRSPTVRAIMHKISDRDVGLIKNNSRRLDLRKWQNRLPQAGHFATLLDALETAKAMHSALGLDKRTKAS